MNECCLVGFKLRAPPLNKCFLLSVDVNHDNQGSLRVQVLQWTKGSQGISACLHIPVKVQ